MRRIYDVLRFHYELGLGQRQIARSLHIAQSTVHDYLALFQKAGLAWPLPEGWQEAQLEKALCTKSPGSAPGQPAPLDLAHIECELQQHRNLTLQLLWEEYRQQHPDGYCYSRFCVQYRRWKQSQDLVMRQDHRAGEKMFVDWAGDTVPLYDRHGGPVLDAPLFVATLGASGYTYAELTATQQLADWIGAHIRALEFFQGVPALVVPDNAKTGVIRACRYDPDLNPTYQELALHYGFGVIPARPAKPRDKALVEVAVQIAQRWIVAALRHRRLFGLAEGNQAVRELLAKLNQRPFRKRAGSRASVYLTLDKPALRPLPAEPYDRSEWSHAKVNIDYHIAWDGNFYSVPYALVGKEVEVRATPLTVEIFYKRERVASHTRASGNNHAITINEHRPRSHQAYLEWTPERLTEWAAKTGPNTAALVERLLDSYPHPHMGYRNCLGLLRLAKQYSPARMEAAAERALATGACRYQSVKSILAHGLDQQRLDSAESDAPAPPPQHDNIRGPEYFQ